VALAYVILHARRQKLDLVDLPRAKMLAHRPTRNQIRRLLKSNYSDKLLGAAKAAFGLRAKLPSRVREMFDFAD
jgi:hypothetical protein